MQQNRYRRCFSTILARRFLHGLLLLQFFGDNSPDLRASGGAMYLCRDGTSFSFSIVILLRQNPHRGSVLEPQEINYLIGHARTWSALHPTLLNELLIPSEHTSVPNGMSSAVYLVKVASVSSSSRQPTMGSKPPAPREAGQLLFTCVSDCKVPRCV